MARKGGVTGFVKSSPWLYTATAVAGGLGIWAVATAVFAAVTTVQIRRARTAGIRRAY